MQQGCELREAAVVEFVIRSFPRKRGPRARQLASRLRGTPHDQGEAKAFERIVWWWYGHGGGRPEAQKFVEEHPPGRWHEIEDSHLHELVEAYWKIKHTTQ